MAFRQDSFGELKVPLAWTAAVALIVCVVIAVALILSDRRGTVESSVHQSTQQAVDTVAAPVGDVISTPGRWLSGAFDWLGSYWNAAGENRRLKTELMEARRVEDRATALALENARLRTMLKVATDPAMPMVTARVVFDGRGPYRRAQLANAGSGKGVKIGFPVISERGVIGRVVAVSPNASRILLLKDVSSRTPVMIARSNARAILTGDGGDNPRLENLRGADPVREGDKVLTSGDGGIYPRGLPVGRAVKGLDGRWRVALDSDTAPMDWVRIIQFEDFSQIEGGADMTSGVLPDVKTEDPAARGSRTIAVPQTATPAPKTASPPAGVTPAPKTATPPAKAATPPAPKAAAPVQPKPAPPPAAKAPAQAAPTGGPP
ncbi:rod shape-determining protein MreC [Caulobacter sp. SLTY]|uniref:rod shape-determining protein MreC n=1 Tax=Caulobacter sp. SLTY TaxID=2683262 RepID=UPI001412A106|nr:rod shape-determining protein MreC [Caulobacter sp. SLTY]